MTFSKKIQPVKTKDMLIGALLRVPAEAIHRRIIHELNAAGFKELSLPHMAVFRFPGPDGVRPGVLAERAGDEQAGHEPAAREPRRSRISGPFRRARRGSRANCPLYEARARRVRKGRRGASRYRARMARRAWPEGFHSTQGVAFSRMGESAGPLKARGGSWKYVANRGSVILTAP